MIGFNHGLAGGLIGKYVPWPVGIPLALASHFVLDALPHYGIEPKKRDKSKFWKYFFTLDAFSTAGLAWWAVYYQHYAMAACGFIAIMPDLIWVARVVRTHSFDLSQNTTHFTRWHVRIQRYERPWGIYIELPLAAILFYFVILQTK